MLLYILGAVVAVVIVVSALLQDNGGLGRSRSASSGAWLGAFLLFVALFSVAGNLSWFAGVVILILKLVEVAPVASWTWFEAAIPFLAGFAASFVAQLIIAFLKK